VVTANQRFPIFFSEKRPFFLEGIDIFQTPITAVHTRAIVNDDLNYDSPHPFTTQLVPGFRRNSRTFFIKASYLIRKGF